MGYAPAAVDSHSEVRLPMGSVKRLGRGKINGSERHSLPRRGASKIANRRSMKRIAGGMIWRGRHCQWLRGSGLCQTCAKSPVSSGRG